MGTPRERGRSGTADKIIDASYVLDSEYKPGDTKSHENATVTLVFPADLKNGKDKAAH